MPAKTIFITGISGSGSRYFCSKYPTQDKKVKIYHTGDMVYELAQNYSQTPIPKENLLNLQPDMLSNLRDSAFERIIDNLKEDKSNYDTIFIDTHSQFFWNNVYENAYDWKHLNQIPADMFVTIIDKPSSIKANQLKRPHGRTQDHDLRDLLLWQNVEVNVTKGWASHYQKPMYVFSRRHNPGDIDALMNNSFLIYSSFPMTDATKEDTRKINLFKEKLRELRVEFDSYHTPMINPADIDVETDLESRNDLSEREKKAINVQTVHRDLN